MKQQKCAEIARAVEEIRKTTQQQISQMQQDHQRQMQESQGRIQQAESQVKRVQDQAKFEIERADKEREMAAAAAIEIEMQRVQDRESKVDQLLETFAERQKVQRARAYQTLRTAATTTMHR